MGFFFLYFLLLVLIPLSVGAAMALGLGELYARVYAPELDVSQQEEIGGPDTASETAVTEMGVEMETLKPAPSDSPPSSYGEDAAEQAVPLVVPSEVSLETEDAVSPAGESDPEKEEPEELGEITAPPSASKSVFDDEELVTTDDFGSVIDDMLEEKDKAVPKDLALLIGEDAADTNGNFDDFEDGDDDFFGENEDDAVARAMEMGEDFGEADFADDEDALSPISSTAKEVLGEDFDFDSLVPSNDAEESADAASKIPAPAPLIERDGGVYWAETSSVTNGTPAANLLPEQQEIVVVFPEEMVTDSIVEPDRSALAKQYSSVEESRPMLVRRKRKT